MSTPEVHEPIVIPVREWVAPQIECYEVRPEVTAYAGGDGSWPNR